MNYNFPNRISIAQLPTPIQKLERLSSFLGGPEIYIKRDDFTGMAISGNKVRKLEFVLAEAISQGCDTLITCGGIQSNHARATAAVAAHLGLKAHLVLAGESTKKPDGNYFLDLLLGSEVSFYPTDDMDVLNEHMNTLASYYEKEGRTPFIVPLGASSGTGSLGYVYSVQEMSKQFEELGFEPDYIVVASGSGGTQAGLIIGKELFGISSQIIGINVRCDEMYFHKEISRIFNEFRHQHGNVSSTKLNINIIDGYVGNGYAKTRPEEMKFIAHLAKTEGLILDPTYTGKAMYGLSREIQKGTFRKKQKLLFIHTGGLFGLFPYGEQFYNEIYYFK